MNMFVLERKNVSRKQQKQEQKLVLFYDRICQYKSVNPNYS